MKKSVRWNSKNKQNIRHIIRHLTVKLFFFYCVECSSTNEWISGKQNEKKINGKDNTKTINNKQN